MSHDRARRPDQPIFLVHHEELEFRPEVWRTPLQNPPYQDCNCSNTFRDEQCQTIGT